MKLEHEIKIVDAIKDMASSRPPYTVFTDWVKIMALSTVNALAMIPGKVWRDRENAYLGVIKNYTDSEIRKMAEMRDWLIECYEENGPYDALGHIYMMSGSGNKGTGQFFTPFHLSELLARLNLENTEQENIIINEPSAGGGGMILAAAKKLMDDGKNPQTIMKIVAQDLDWNCVYMSYVQLAYNGLDAIVVQGSTLAEPYHKNYPEERTFRTPKNMGMF